MAGRHFFTSESVTEGHPDKVCDQISDAILDEIYARDPMARVACETAVTTGLVLVMGEITTDCYVDIPRVVRETIRDIGYTRAKYGFDCDTCAVLTSLDEQSPDIARGVERSWEVQRGLHKEDEDAIGAGDQGMMFGYACDDTEELLPLAQVILQKLSKEYFTLSKVYNHFLPDGKAQITGYYDDNFKLVKIKTFTISYQNLEMSRDFTDKIIKNVAIDICNEYGIEIEEFLINPTGKFLIGGFEGDAGLTGRKIVVDTYHSFANVGGGAFSGKDNTKVDRSGAYKARQIAKRMLRQHNLRWCEVQLSYAIGKAEPLAIYIDSSIGNIEPSEELYRECKPLNIIHDLDLRKQIYKQTAMFGHFGNNGFEWEK